MWKKLLSLVFIALVCLGLKGKITPLYSINGFTDSPLPKRQFTHITTQAAAPVEYPTPVDTLFVKRTDENCYTVSWIGDTNSIYDIQFSPDRTNWNSIYKGNINVLVPVSHIGFEDKTNNTLSVSIGAYLTYSQGYWRLLKN